MCVWVSCVGGGFASGVLSLFESISTANTEASQNVIKVAEQDMIGVVTSVGNMLVDYKHKFAFCPIQKAGSSIWTQLFLRMNGDKYW